MNFKSYLRQSRRFSSTFFGSGGEYLHLAKTRRGEIKNMSHDSFIRLCFFVDSFSEFILEILIRIKFEKKQNYEIKKIKTKLSNFLKSLSSYDRQKEHPLFIWRLIFDNEKKLVINIISNTKTEPLVLLELSKIIWNNAELKLKTDISVFRISRIITDICIIQFCTEDTEYLHKVGRWWGAINQKYYHRKKIQCISKNPNVIKEKVNKLKEVKNKQIKRNFYTK